MSTILGNPSIYAPGADITAHATSPVTARRFVAISGDRVAGGNIAVAPAPAGARAFGVAAHDGATGALVTVVRGNSRVVKVAAASAIAAGAEVEVGTAGKAAALASGIAVGYAITSAASNTDAEISLY
ncbi:Uncharacterised protein [Mycobacteroides abscessus subsp. abscessus]|uniref:capsid cement protein n=1 Tax=Mycobacteroides abscessus TaxID=36809 RepID=UPI000926E478|nr:capsid cement protein [Mycobacteroides abscessus]SIM07995.1 Uncharacterised protein [Mycobacteroides abscessus subsp. abscessus]